MRTDRQLSVTVQFDGDCTTAFNFRQMDDYPDKMYFGLTDSDEDEEENVQCVLGLDEAEYLAHRLLDFIEWQKRK